MKNFKLNSIIVFALFLFALMSAELTSRFRYILNLHWVYLIGVFSAYLFHIAAFIFSLICLIAILRKDVIFNFNYKWLWITLSLIPVLFWIIGILSILLHEEL